MNNQESKIIASVTFFFLSAIAGLLIILSKSDLCWNQGCSHDYAGTVAFPMLYTFVPAFVASLVMMFSSDKSYRIWKAVSVLYIPILAVLVFLAPLSCDLESCYDKNGIAKTLGVIFFALSFLMVFLFRKEKTETNE